MSRTLGIMMAFVAGWVDASSFVGLDHIMAAHVTGNLVVLAANIAQGFEAHDLLKIGVLPIFFAAVMVITVIHDRLVARHDDTPHQLHALFGLQAGLLALTGLMGAVLTVTGERPGFWGTLIVVTPAVVAMAVQNAAHRFYPVIGPATTVMTGNITQFFIDHTRLLGGRQSVSKIADMPKDENLLPFMILSFGTGCVVGALATVTVGNGAFLVAAAVSAAAIGLLRRETGR